MKAGKVWGQTELIHANGVLEFHRIEYKAGKQCSEHLHEFKWNGFYVESGKMMIRVWQNDYDLVDETILGPGDFTQVKPGVMHQFVGLEAESHLNFIGQNLITMTSRGEVSVEQRKRDPKVMYLDYRLWFNKETQEITLDPELDWGLKEGDTWVVMPDNVLKRYENKKLRSETLTSQDWGGVSYE